MKRSLSAVLLLMMAVTLAGCGEDGPDFAPVTGTVTYKGEPVADASVIFQPEAGPVAAGTTDAQGKFTLMSKDKEGAAVGPGLFTVVKVEKTAEVMEVKPGEETEAMMQQVNEKDRPKSPKSLIPQKYNNPASSDLKFTVDPDGANNDFKLELKD